LLLDHMSPLGAGAFATAAPVRESVATASASAINASLPITVSFA
jgi:hypothetical protein